MTPRCPHPLTVLPVLLALATLTACGDGPGPAPRASDGASTANVSTPTAEPTPDEPTPTPPTPGQDERLPDDLDLGAGLDKAATWSEFRLEGPGRNVEGVPMVDFCDPGAETWPGPVVDRIAVRETGPEHEHSREVLLYPSADAARTVLADLRAVATDCPVALFRAGRESREDRLHQVMEPDGPDVTTVGVHYRGVLGSGTYQLRRVGRTLLAARDLGEGTVEGLRADARRLTTALDTLLEVIGTDLP